MEDTPIVVIDTNVMVSGLLSPFGKPGMILNLLLSRRLRLAYDDRILIEYRDVVGRPKFRFSSVQIERLFAVFPFQKLVSPDPWSYPPSPDPADTVFLEVASVATKTLITGNVRHFPENCCGDVTVMSPAQWLQSTD